MFEDGPAPARYVSGSPCAYDDLVVTRSGALTPAQQLKVLALVWDKGHDMDGWVFLPWIPGWCKDKAQRRANWHEGSAFKWPQQRDEILTHLENHRQDDLYFTPNTFLGESRVAQFTGEEKALYADLDEVNPTDDIDPDLRPTIAWETSPGRFQGIWLLDSFADGCTEAGGLNHRLTAAIGADPSGWDTTQLLRVPGRRNFKPGYKDDEGDSPPGRLLWINTKRYSPDWLGNRLPTVEVYGTGADVEDYEIDAVDRAEVYGRVRMKIGSTVRHYLGLRSRQINPEEYDRSEVLWQIERDLADAGCTVAEIVSIVRETPWNKHEGRNNELAQLKAEAAKAIGVAIEDAKEKPLEDAQNEAVGNFLNVPTFLDFGTSALDRPAWLVRNIWAKGSVGFISGAPKSYKSYFALDLAISVAMGRPFLNHPEFSTGKAVPVLYIQEEDSAPIVKYRMEQIAEAKAPEAFWAGQMTLEGDDTSGRDFDALGVTWTPPTLTTLLRPAIRRGFSISSGAWQTRLAEAIEENGYRLVVIDTLGTTLGDIELNDSVKMNERVLKPLKQMAEAFNCAIAIVHHNKKGDSTGRLGQAMLGSVAMHAWVESALYVQSKEKDTNSPHSEVKVERENKLAEDMKLRVRIPTMWQEKGPGTEGDRQVWEPEVFHGWSESNDVTAAMEEVAPPKNRSRQGGAPIAEFVQSLGEGWHDFEDIKEEYGRNPGATLNQLKKAVINGFLQHDEENDRYRVIG